ncbi:ABC transporter ATP-binding protein [Maledivibacter halophilus]|uniref:Peptide/nickel transport system ATP-binding protein n=1 Tax=Maledivibacter halophilus TaxID=36842 RepID=A0A1T5MQK9_9FIRM|nr:ABC transporter ATP-binding protein [Maledivibacter halophilus]SKC90178.1 peptide/nickel transport system ATP-binding protein [Maledivibacter halophilus]
MAEEKKLLEIKNLTVHYITDDGTVRALEDMNLEIGYGETLGFVGETGAGKTTTAKSIMCLLPDPPAKIMSGEILFEKEDLLKKSIKDIRQIRGDKISMIFQDPMTALNPVMTVGEQIAEGIMLHQNLKKEAALAKANEMLETVGIKSFRSKDYPHQFSGGMKQRVVIAMALACNPKLLIADEPTTALDVTIQAQVLKLMQQLKEKYKTSMIMITHDLGVVAEACDKVAVIYAGNVVEYTDKKKLFTNPSHPYTIGLFGCIPDVFSDEEELSPIEGLMPDPTNLPSGCPFHPRCPKAIEKCSKEKPKNVDIKDNHFVKCFLFQK